MFSEYTFFRATKPGGWVELGQYERSLFSDDGTVKENSFTSRFYTLLNKAADQTSISRPQYIQYMPRVHNFIILANISSTKFV
jgi:hypothetical protein